MKDDCTFKNSISYTMDIYIVIWKHRDHPSRGELTISRSLPRTTALPFVGRLRRNSEEWLGMSEAKNENIQPISAWFSQQHFVAVTWHRTCGTIAGEKLKLKTAFMECSTRNAWNINFHNKITDIVNKIYFT